MYRAANIGKRHVMVRVALLAMMLMAGTATLPAQSFSIPTDSSHTVTVQSGASITVNNPDGGNGNYPNFCNGTLTLVSSAATVISLSGNYSIESDYDILYVYDGLSIRDHLIGSFSGTGVANITANSGAITFIFFSNNTVNQMGFSLTGSVCDTAALQARNVVVENLSDTSALLRWDDIAGSTAWTVRYGTHPNSLSGQMHVYADSALLTNLTPNTRYYYRIYSNGATTTINDLCNVTMRQFHTPCADTMTPCVNYTDLYSCYCEARYGTYANPDLNTGIDDTRITVLFDDSTDSLTGNQLHTIPDGYSSSVRLGNQMAGGQAENVTYHYHVDTLVHDLLLLKYAAVLEDPSHTADEQPRFAFQILDSSGIQLNPTCYSADFAASANLGWNTFTTTINDTPTDIRWKDWTTVGVDLTPLHGQDIYIRLSTYDCARHQHFGYAYYILDCTDKSIEYTNCGTSIENTFTAPEGFSYRWCNADNPTVTLDTTQSLHVTQAGDYICTLTYGTVPGSSCSFNLTATAGQRLPAALFSWEEAGNDSCDVVVQFHNGSVISRDAAHQQLTDEPCESVTWFFDDGTTSTDDNPQHTFPMGLHTVRLAATIGNGGCTDTTTQEILIHSPCEYSDTISATICDGQSYVLFDTTLTATGTYHRDSGYLHRTLFLTVNPTYQSTLYDTIVENSLPYTFADTTIAINTNQTSTTSPTSLNSSISRTFPSVDGCDSTLNLNLHVWLNRSTQIDSTICSDALPFTWHDTTITYQQNNNTNFQFSIINSQLTSHGADSSITLTLTVHPSYSISDTTTICYGDTDPYGFTTAGDHTLALTTQQGCDSTLHVHVNVMPVYHFYVTDTIVENDLPYTFADTTIASQTSSTSLTSTTSLSKTFLSVNGCDSTVDLTLHVWLNRSTHIDSTICADALPFTWHDTTITYQQYNNASSQTSIINSQFSIINSQLTSHGADSTITLSLTVRPTYEVNDTSVICDGDTAAYGFTAAGVYDVPLTTVLGCDSLLHLTVIVNPVYDLHYYDTLCDNQFPYHFADTTIAGNTSITSQTSTTSILRTFFSISGCDSTATLHLTVNPTHITYEHALVCDGVPFTWKDGNTYSYSTYEPSIMYSDVNGCDSMLYLILDLNDSFKASMNISPGVASYEHSKVRLQDNSASSRREWFFNNYTDTSRVVIFDYPLNEDSVEVLMVARNTSGCVDSVIGTVFFDRAVIWAPNAFTPDEPVNNRFFILSDDLLSGEIFIYNRYGILVTRFDAIDGSWDGTCKGRPCTQASYTWIMNYTIKSQPRIVRQAKGTVTLIK